MTVKKENILISSKSDVTTNQRQPSFNVTNIGDKTASPSCLSGAGTTFRLQSESSSRSLKVVPAV